MTHIVYHPGLTQYLSDKKKEIIKQTHNYTIKDRCHERYYKCHPEASSKGSEMIPPSLIVVFLKSPIPLPKKIYGEGSGDFKGYYCFKKKIELS